MVGPSRTDQEVEPWIDIANLAALALSASATRKLRDIVLFLCDEPEEIRTRVPSRAKFAGRGYGRICGAAEALPLQYEPVIPCWPVQSSPHDLHVEPVDFVCLLAPNIRSAAWCGKFRRFRLHSVAVDDRPSGRLWISAARRCGPCRFGTACSDAGRVKRGPHEHKYETPASTERMAGFSWTMLFQPPCGV